MTVGESESMQMLADGELDGFVTVDTYLSGKTVVPVAKIGYSEFFFAVNKARSDLLEELDNAMSRLQDENRFYNQELLAKYIGSSGSNMFLSAEEKNGFQIMKSCV